MMRHFTATAFIVDSQKRTLLLWHNRKQRWMPPGGHIDEDEIPSDAARRECKEETGLDVEIIGDPQQDLFADCSYEGRMLIKPVLMLLEEIPGSTEHGKPDHQHMDFVFIARPLDESQELNPESDETVELRWFTREEIAELGEDEMYRNVREYMVEYLGSG
jgi:8-oxo-dGTP pyrophosphatase MutT (NUDIX family)